MSFHQPNWEVQGDVYNVAGDLLLTKNGSREDFIQAILSLKNDLLREGGLDEVARAEIAEDFDKAAAAAQKPDSHPDEVVGWLDSAKARLLTLGGAAGALLTLATSVSQLIGWAGKFL